MQFTTIALTFVAAVAAVAPNAAAKQQFIDNYVQNAKRADNGTVASASASAGAGAAAASASPSVAKNSTGSGAGAASTGASAPIVSTLPSSTSGASIVALSGSALFAGIVALVL